MNIKPISVIHRPNGGTEYYGANWFSKNIKIAQSHWNGPAPFSTVLWPRYYSEVKRYGDAWFRFRNAFDITLEILLDGTLEYTQNGITETVQPGEIYIMHEGSDCTFHAYPESYFHRLRLTLCGHLVGSAAQELHLTHHRILRPENLDSYKEEFREIGSMIAKRDVALAPEMSARSYRILAKLAENANCAEPLPERLEQLLSAMKSELDRNFSIQEFALERKIEVHSLMRLFRKHLHASPREYLISMRMEEARHLVGSTELSIKEIAGRLGYANPLYFSSVFHRHFHLSPSRYRENQKNRNRD